MSGWCDEASTHTRLFRIFYSRMKPLLRTGRGMEKWELSLGRGLWSAPKGEGIWREREWALLPSTFESNPGSSSN